MGDTKKPVTISYFSHEAELYRMERINRRLVILCVLSMIAVLIAGHREP